MIEEKIDPLGEYPYRAGYCVQDAFAQFYGESHPLVQEITFSYTFKELRQLCQKYELEHRIENQAFRPQAQHFFDERPTIWLWLPEGNIREGEEIGWHISFVRDSSVVYVNKCAVFGYIKLEEEKEINGNNL